VKVQEKGTVHRHVRPFFPVYQNYALALCQHPHDCLCNTADSNHFISGRHCRNCSCDFLNRKVLQCDHFCSTLGSSIIINPNFLIFKNKIQNPLTQRSEALSLATPFGGGFFVLSKNKISGFKWGCPEFCGKSL
jgi:hypothetical protein